MSERRERRTDEHDSEDRRPAGNAARDPRQQTCREDMPAGQQQEDCAEPGRGSRPPGGPGSRPRVDEDEAARAKGRTRPPSDDPERRAGT